MVQLHFIIVQIIFLNDAGSCWACYIFNICREVCHLVSRVRRFHEITTNHVVANWAQFELSVMSSYFYSWLYIIWTYESGNDLICSLWKLKITHLTCSKPLILVIKLWPLSHCCFSFKARSVLGKNCEVCKPLILLHASSRLWLGG